MLKGLIRFSIRFYGVVVSLAVLLLLYGAFRLSSTGLDIFPEFSPKQVVIQTESPGLSAEQVEVLVSQPIETAISGLIGLKSVRSESIQGLSIVTAIFDERNDVYLNRQMVSERLASLAEKLPAGIGTPVPVPLSSSSATILTIGLSSERKDLMELRSLVDWTIVPRLLSIPGVADVNVFGGEIRQLQIQLDPERLRRYDLFAEDIVAAAKKAVNTYGGGVIENENQRFTLQLSGQPNNPELLRKAVIDNQRGVPLTLGDVAEIRYAPAPPIGAAQISGKPGIVMMVIGQYGANTLSVSRDVEGALSEFTPIFTQHGIDFYSRLFRPADYIETSLKNLTGHLTVGGLFVVVVLYVFLYSFRTAFISATAIPVSLISAAIVLMEAGVNLNIMVLGGLAIALGEVVDDAIIDTENIFRRLRENQNSQSPLPASDIVLKASLEVRGSVVYASFIVALVFVPLLTLSGVAGRLFSPLGVSYILAILMSLLVALTLTPALCYLLLGKRELKEEDPPLIRKIRPGYGRLLRKISSRSGPAIVGGMVVCILGSLVLVNLGSKFLPELREGHYIVHTTSIPGTSLKESIRTGTRLTELFLEIPGVKSVSQWAGRAERGADTYGSHYSEYEVRLEPMSGRDQQRVLENLREILEGFPGILYEANTFLIERIDETISGYTSPVVVNIYGNDLDVLDVKGQEVASIMQGITGATDIQLRSPPGTPVLQVQLKHNQLALWGIHPEQVLKTLQTAYETTVVGKSYQGNRIYDIAVALEPALRNRPESVGRLTLRSGVGGLITLDQVADIQHSEGRYNILHRDNRRLQTVTCNVTGRDLDSFIRELKSAVRKEVAFDANDYPEFTGAAIEQAEARMKLILHSLLAGAGVLLLIYIAIGSLRHMLITLANLPFSLIGGVFAVLITGATLSVGSVVGFITLFGITVRNSIMLISHYRYLTGIERLPWNLDT
ncbi:MAG: efflux RND transporter permease subunit, partial [Gammaproteobacteria bacterium]